MLTATLAKIHGPRMGQRRAHPLASASLWPSNQRSPPSPPLSTASTSPLLWAKAMGLARHCPGASMRRTLSIQTPTFSIHHPLPPRPPTSRPHPPSVHTHTTHDAQRSRASRAAARALATSSSLPMPPATTAAAPAGSAPGPPSLRAPKRPLPWAPWPACWSLEPCWRASLASGPPPLRCVPIPIEFKRGPSNLAPGAPSRIFEGGYMTTHSGRMSRPDLLP